MPNESILIVDDEDEIRDLLEILLESEYSNPILTASSGNEAIQILKDNENIAFIVSDYTMNDGTGGVLFKYNVENNNLPFVLFSGGFLQDYEDMTELFSSNSNNDFLQKPLDTDKLFSLINKALPKDSEINSNDEYKRIQIKHAIYFIENNKDLFLNISKNKFLKVINEGELTCVDQLNKYKEKGESYLYIQKDDFTFFIKEILTNISKRVDSSKNFSDAITIGAEGYEFVHSSLTDMGLLEEHVTLINSVVNKCVENLSKNPKIEILLNSFFKEKGYLVSHSLSCVYVSYLICTYLDYANESVIEKLAYASLLHDLGLKDKDLSEILTSGDQAFLELSQRDKKQVLNHPFESVKLIEEFDDFPNDVENIILEHHESPDGSGFPRSLTALRIAPLSAVFIMSLKFSHFLYFKDFKNDIDSFIQELEAEFNKGNFKKPLRGLLTSIRKAL